MSTTNSQINQIAGREFGRANQPPVNYFIGLLLQTPNPDGTGINEVPTAGTGYVRQVLPNNQSALTAPNNGQVTNVAAVQFPAATASWGSITDVGIFDSLTGGNLLYMSTQPLPKPFDMGDIAFFEAGGIVFIVQNIID